jgi:hypothetical protein
MPRKNPREIWREEPRRTRQREELRRSNAAGPHPRPRKDEEIPDQQEDAYDDVEFGLFDWLGKDLDPDA